MEPGTIVKYKDMQVGGIYQLTDADDFASIVFVGYKSNSYNSNIDGKVLISLTKKSKGFLFWKGKSIEDQENSEIWEAKFLGMMPDIDLKNKNE